MQEIKDPKKTPGTKNVIYYYIVSLVVIILLNALLFPAVVKNQVIEVPYNQFLEMVDQGSVKQVALDETNSELVFTTGSGSDVKYYKTGIWPDDGQRLLNQLRSNSSIEFRAEIPTQVSPLLTFFLEWVLPFLLFIVFWEFLSRYMQKRMGGKMPGGLSDAMSFGKSGAKVYVEAQTGKTFRDVAGQDEAKESLEEVVDFLHEPQKYASVGAKCPKGVLLVGPPGTGKTLLAKAVAGEAQVPFFSISGSEFVEMFVGMGAAKVRDLFKQANEKAPCIVFIDEIDTIGKKRDSVNGGNDEREQTLNQLLAEMDGFDSSKGVVLLGATNRPESLDPALLRPGRFDRRIPVELPDLAGREAILKVHARDVKIADNIDYSAIARATSGASGAELANIINEAALRAVRMKRSLRYAGRSGRIRGDGHCGCTAKECGPESAGEEDRRLS
jgi:cell division protease FtsH